MPSSPTPRNRIVLQGTGDNAGTWGSVLNTQALGLIDDALDGFESIAVNGNVTLSSTDYATDQSRNRVLRFTGAGGHIVTIPGVEKFYIVHNSCVAPVTIKTTAGAGAVIAANQVTFVYCDSVACHGATYTGSSTFSQKIVGPATTSSSASLNLPPGNAPTSPAEGDVWTTSAGGIYYRANSVTRTPGMELLSQGEFSAASLISLKFVGNYSSYRVIASRILPSFTGTVIGMYVSTDNAATWKGGATDYYWAADYIDSTGTRIILSSTGFPAILLTNDIHSTSGGIVTLDIQFDNMRNASYFKNILWHAGYMNPAFRCAVVYGNGMFKGGGQAITDVALVGTGGVGITLSGLVSLYGMK